MKIYFDNLEFDAQFLRAIDYAPLGAQIFLRRGEGGGEHCEAGARDVFFQRMFDWLDPILAR